MLELTDNLKRVIVALYTCEFSRLEAFGLDHNEYLNLLMDARITDHHIVRSWGCYQSNYGSNLSNGEWVSMISGSFVWASSSKGHMYWSRALRNMSNHPTPCNAKPYDKTLDKERCW